MRKDALQITLGTAGEFEMLGLALPGIEGAKDPASLVRLPIDTALRLLRSSTKRLSPKSKLPRAKRPGSVTRGTGRRSPRHRLEDLLKQVTQRNRHPGIDWGSPVGREVW